VNKVVGHLVIKNKFLALDPAAFASRKHARALAAGLPRQNHFYITIDELLRFHNNEFDSDGMLCKLDSTEYPRWFEKYSIHSFLLSWVANTPLRPNVKLSLRLSQL